MDGLNELKKKYNEKLQRNKDAEEYFKNNTVEQCLKHLDLFNQVVKELSELIMKIEKLTGKNMTHYEIINGFSI